jgi:hypothetical protein
MWIRVADAGLLLDLCHHLSLQGYVAVEASEDEAEVSRPQSGGRARQQSGVRLARLAVARRWTRGSTLGREAFERGWPRSRTPLP